MLSIVAGITLALAVFLSISSFTQKAVAGDWCDPPPGCAFGGCTNQSRPGGVVVKVCNFYKTDNAASCSGHPNCGTSPGGDDGGPIIVPTPEN